MLLAELVVLQSWPIPLQAQDQQPATLSISILEGEGSVNTIRQRVAREAMVQVDDENHKPVAGVLGTFSLPDRGASGVFSNGTRSLSVTTDNAGHAVAQGIVPNKVAGDVQIHVVAQFRNLNADAIIHTQNAVVAGSAGGAAASAGISGKVLALIIIAAAAGVAGGVIAATRGGGSSSPPPETITAGTATVGAPPATVQPRRKH